YNLTNATASTAADITARGLAVTATAANKVYDGTTDATVSLSDDRVRGDVLSTSYASASFDNANAGAGKVVTVSGISVAGADSGNYTFNTSTTTSADIAKRAITVTADAQSKLFGDADPALTYQVSGGPLVSGDSFSGNLSRDPGEAPGQYSILQGSVSAGPNYAVTYVGAKLTIGAWTLKGFYAPVDMGIWNTVKAGSTVPMKFEVFKGATELKSVSDIKSAAHKQVSCAALNTTAADAVELTTTASTSLRFDTTSDQFIFNWKTQSGWAVNSCYVVTVVTQDGTPLSAYFKMK
ncbi:MAG: PxKF domain-containing protein, partial [Actinomycetota bacterium]|nr:PxKF domain-containing protein [Actinomycetota bacterium]